MNKYLKSLMKRRGAHALGNEGAAAAAPAETAAAATGTPAAAAAVPGAVDPANVAIGGLGNASTSAPGGRPLALANANTAFAGALNQRLSAFAMGYPADDVDALINFLAPRVESPLVFEYQVDPDSNVLAAVKDDGVGASGKPGVIRADAKGKVQASLQMKGLETFLTLTEMMVADSMPDWGRMKEKQEKVAWLHGARRRSKAQRLFALIGTVLTANPTQKEDVTFGANDNPVAIVKARIKAVASVCGSRNDVRVLFGADAIDAFSGHAMLAGGGNGIPTQAVTMQRIAELLGLPVANIQVSYNQVYDDSTKKRVNIFGESDILVFSARQNATRNDPSFLKDFWGKLNGMELWVYEYNAHPSTDNFGEAEFEHLAVTMSGALRRMTVVAEEPAE